jgi:hypothetical protein
VPFLRGLRANFREIERTGELGFEPKRVTFRWHSHRIAFTSQAIETPKVKGKPHFDHIVRMSRSCGQYCPQFAESAGGLTPWARRRRMAGVCMTCKATSGSCGTDWYFPQFGVLRGGRWENHAKDCPTAYRHHPWVNDRTALVGFRVVQARSFPILRSKLEPIGTLSVSTRPPHWTDIAVKPEAL